MSVGDARIVCGDPLNVRLYMLYRIYKLEDAKRLSNDLTALTLGRMLHICIVAMTMMAGLLTNHVAMKPKIQKWDASRPGNDAHCFAGGKHSRIDTVFVAPPASSPLLHEPVLNNLPFVLG